MFYSVFVQTRVTFDKNFRFRTLFSNIFRRFFEWYNDEHKNNIKLLESRCNWIIVKWWLPNSDKASPSGRVPIIEFQENLKNHEISDHISFLFIWWGFWLRLIQKFDQNSMILEFVTLCMASQNSNTYLRDRFDWIEFVISACCNNIFAFFW